LKVATNFTSSFKLSKKREEIKLQKAQTDAPVEATHSPKISWNFFSSSISDVLSKASSPAN